MQATGHTSLTVQLTPEEYEIYKNVPTLFDKETDLYTMPPTPSGLLKWGLHHKGAVSAHSVSTPRTGVSKDNDSPLDSTARVGVDGAGASCAVPKRMLKPMRDAMRKLYPDIADRDFASSRICWYADTSDEDWIVDYHPDHPRLLLATGGSGHGFKFLPVLGRVIADRLENKLDVESRDLFSFTRVRSDEHVERAGESFEIVEEELTIPTDLKAK
ncbi:FAD dependent oxidoreductase [Rhizoctonia solani]|nr:FAD dependent oxidoreductase [Rhizoctonia solani]